MKTQKNLERLSDFQVKLGTSDTLNSSSKIRGAELPSSIIWCYNANFNPPGYWEDRQTADAAGGGGS